MNIISVSVSKQFGMFVLKIAVIILSLRVFSNGSEINCGKKVVASGLIVGGILSKRNEWPWLVSLVSLPSRRYFCGATIISERTVLTAAHCVRSKHSAITRKISEFEVQLGKHDLDENDVTLQTFDTDTIAVHPDWDSNDDRYDADLALLLTLKVINVTANTLPVCLWSDSSMDSSPDSQYIGTVVGWGVSERYGSSNHENTPRQVQVIRVPSEDCFIEYHLLASIASKRTFCVRGVKENSGPCLGDSGGLKIFNSLQSSVQSSSNLDTGGGLFVQIGNSWFINGIVSSSFTSPMGKCDVTQLTLFTDLSKYKDWISQQINSLVIPLSYIPGDSDDL